MAQLTAPYKPRGAPARADNGSVAPDPARGPPGSYASARYAMRRTASRLRRREEEALINKARRKPPWTVRRSPTHGRGAFATRAIRKGERIIEYRGTRSSWSTACRRPWSDPSDPYHTLLFGLTDGTVIDAGLDGNAARWFNHGCDPNCETIEYDDGKVFIHARRRIRRGEELRYDYRLSFPGRISRRARQGLACRCGAARCRGTLLLTAKAPTKRIAPKH